VECIEVEKMPMNIDEYGILILTEDGGLTYYPSKKAKSKLNIVLLKRLS
jgi:hypothetical protein